MDLCMPRKQAILMTDVIHLIPMFFKERSIQQ